MSDSRNKENNTAQTSVKKIVSDPAKPKSTLPISKIPKTVYVLGAVLVLVLTWFAVTLFVEYRENDTSNKDQNSRLNGDTPKIDEPISILPRAPEGITVINKQPELNIDVNAPQISVTSGAIATAGFAMELGTALSFSELSTRFLKIINDNGPENFNRLEPRAVLTETITGLEAKLLVGPFENEALAKEACDVLQLPENIECKTSVFEGELIARQ